MPLLWFSALSFLAVTQEPPGALRHVIVYREEGRFAGWPANHGIWSWGDEILVGFSRGYYKDRGSFHHIDKEKPEEFLLARSRDGGATWSLEEPRPRGTLAGTPGMRHGTMPAGLAADQPIALREPIRFDHPDFAMTVRMENSNNGMSRFFFSYDRGTHWYGPYRLPLFDQKGVMGRQPFGIYARLSSDLGKTWNSATALRDDAGGRDIGYVRSIVRPDGHVVAVYYYHDRTGPTRYLAATIWDSGKP